ncbi:ammonium transporter AmtB-like domain-containing protein [Phlebopus sp. FC_14]|nr:ammonium transporter AmtB-like domain-containing protein [Phlebopus sp. FC_14]
MVNVTYDTSGDLTWSNGLESDVFNLGDIAWTLVSAVLAWITIPGFGFFFSGLLQRKNALSMLYLSMMTSMVVSLQWYLLGYSLAFSDSTNPFMGDLKYFALRNVLEQPSVGSARIPAIVFCVFQLMFATFTPMIATGALAERGRLGPTIVFVFIWSTLVYDPIVRWTWNPNGWAYVFGNLDFAGGTPVHITAGSAALAISFYIGRRRGYGTMRLAYRPHNVTYIVLGTVFIWFGSFGINGGSALSANLRAAEACVVTYIAASVGGLTWLLVDWRLEHKWSVVGLCSGVLCGLVAISPASGFVSPSISIIFGFVGSFVCNYATMLKFLIGCDDTLDIFATHAVAAFAGNMLTALFAQSSIASTDGTTSIAGGWLDHNYRQLGIQLAVSVAAFVYCYVITTLILWVMHFIPVLRLRCSEEAELLGIDDAEMGETIIYQNDATVDHDIDRDARIMQERNEELETYWLVPEFGTVTLGPVQYFMKEKQR